MSYLSGKFSIGLTMLKAIHDPSKYVGTTLINDVLLTSATMRVILDRRTGKHRLVLCRLATVWSGPDRGLFWRPLKRLDCTV
jgi:hypothetical protein